MYKPKRLLKMSPKDRIGRLVDVLCFVLVWTMEVILLIAFTYFIVQLFLLLYLC